MSCKKSPPNFYPHCSTQQKYNIHGYQRKESVLPYTAPHPKPMQAQGALNTYTGKNKRALTTSVIRAHIKKGSYLLSRIALQYHRRKWA